MTLIYQSLQNNVSKKLKVSNNLIHQTLHNSYVTISFEDLSLWNKVIEGYRFVRYNRVTLNSFFFSELEKYMNEYEPNTFLYCKEHKSYLFSYVGRYEFETINGLWVVDVVFPNSINVIKKLSHYCVGNDGLRNNWLYDLKESSMCSFVMNIINKLDYSERILEIVVRTIMSNFSLDNSAKSLIEGRWDGNYSKGKKPTDWTRSMEIFREREKTGKPIKYGQCWIYAECFNSVMKYLNIPTRTVYALNSHINLSLNFAIDFYCQESFDKGEEYDCEETYKNILDLANFIDNEDKDDVNFSDEVYINNDSIWNMHYWNEIYIPSGDGFDWECLDSCPSVATQHKILNGNKILGPCKVKNIKNALEENYDFAYLSSSVNSPFRLWTKSVVNVRGEPTLISYVHSIIYPFYPEESIISRKNNNKMKDKVVKLSVKNEFGIKIDITDDYKMSYKDTLNHLNDKSPCIFIVVNKEIYVSYKKEDNTLYNFQQVALNHKGIPILTVKNTSTIKDLLCIEYKHNMKYLSVLIQHGKKYWVQLIEV